MRRTKSQKTFTQAELPFSSPNDLTNRQKPQKYFEVESTPWFTANDSTPENAQINNYIAKRFSEFNDEELTQFLKNNPAYRKIVGEIRGSYLYAEKKSSRRKAS